MNVTRAPSAPAYPPLAAQGVRAAEGEFGDYLARRIREAGLSLRALARASGIGHTTLSRLVNGKLRPTATVVLAIAPHLGEPAARLLARAGLQSGGLDAGLQRLGLPFELQESELRAELWRRAETALAPEMQAQIEAEFAAKLARAGAIGPVAGRLQALHAAYSDPARPPEARRLAGGALLYFLDSADRIDDELLSVGYLDDALVAALAWEELEPPGG